MSFCPVSSAAVADLLHQVEQPPRVAVGIADQMLPRRI